MIDQPESMASSHLQRPLMPEELILCDVLASGVLVLAKNTRHDAVSRLDENPQMGVATAALAHHYPHFEVGTIRMRGHWSSPKAYLIQAMPLARVGKMHDAGNFAGLGVVDGRTAAGKPAAGTVFSSVTKHRSFGGVHTTLWGKVAIGGGFEITHCGFFSTPFNSTCSTWIRVIIKSPRTKPPWRELFSRSDPTDPVNRALPALSTQHTYLTTHPHHQLNLT